MGVYMSLFSGFKDIFNKKKETSRWAGHSEILSDNLPLTTSSFHFNHKLDLPDDFFERDEVEEIIRDIQTNSIIVLYGMGGIGKSTLLTMVCERKPCNKLAYFDLKNKDSFVSISKAFLREVFFKSVLPDNEDELIKLMIECLSKETAIIIFDNMESIMDIGENSGNISSEFAGYDKLIRRILEESTSSTIIVSGREKMELGQRFGSKYTLKKLGSINVEQAKVMLKRFSLTGNDNDWERFVETYSGNALTLKIVASEIRDAHDGVIPDFLNTPNMPHELLTLLNEQFSRFTDIEKTVLLISAIEREPLEAKELWAKIVGVTITLPSLFKNISNIVDHCFLETISEKNKYYLQPVIMEFLTQKLIDLLVEEISNERINFIAKIPLIDTFAKEYILDIQKELIVFPLRDILLQCGEEKCFEMLMSLVKSTDITKNYAVGNVITLLSTFNDELCGCDFSSKYVLNTDLRFVKLKRCNFQQSTFENVLMLNTFGNLIDVKYSFNDKLIIGGATDYSFNAWDCKDMSYEFKLCNHTDWVRSVDSNEFLYASASNDESICVYDYFSNNLIAKFWAESRVRKVALLPDSEQYVLSSGDDGFVRLWNILENDCLKFSGHTKVVWDLEVIYFDNDFKVISVSDDKKVIMWNLDGTIYRTLQTMECEIKSITSNKEDTVFWGCENGTIIAFSLSEMKVIATLNAHKGIVWGLDYDGIHRRLLSAASDKHVIMWDCSQNEIRKIKVVDAHNSSIWNVNYNHAGTQFVTTGDDSEFKVWDAIDFKLLYCIKGYTNLLRNIHISIERQSLFIAGDDMIIREYFLDNLDVPRKIYIGHTNRVRHVDVSPNGKLLVSCGDDGNVILWNIERKTHKCYKGHKKRVWTVSFISNDEFVSAGEENDIYLWNTNSITPKILMGHSNWIWDLSYFSEKKLLVSSGEDNTCILWNMDNREVVARFSDHTKWLFAASFSPSGKYIVTASADSSSIIYDVESSEIIFVLKGHNGWVWSAIFIDENTIATGGQDSNIIIWKVDYENKQCEKLKTLAQHESWVVSLAFDNTSRLLYSASADETVKVWKNDDYSYVRDVAIDKPYEGITISGVKGLTESERVSLLHLGAIE